MLPGIRIGALAVVPLLAAGCSLPAPEREIHAADAAIALANDMGASRTSPAQLQRARDKLAWSRNWVKARDNEPARWLAEQAKVDAELAQARAATARVMFEAARDEAELRAMTRTRAVR